MQDNQARPKDRMCTMGMTCSTKWIFSQQILTCEQTCTDNAKMVPSKAFRGERQYKLPGVRLGGPRSGIQPHSLEDFFNYSEAVRTSSVTVIQGPLFRQLGPRSRVWSLRGWMRRSLCFRGTMAALNWVGSREAGLFVLWEPAKRLQHTSGEDRSGLKTGTVPLLLLLVESSKSGESPNVPPPCVLPQFDWLSCMGTEIEDGEIQQKPPKNRLHS